MTYYGKVKDGEYIVGIFTTTALAKRKSDISIAKKEYDKILSVINKGCKENQRLLEKDGEYFYVDVEIQDPEEKGDE